MKRLTILCLALALLAGCAPAAAEAPAADAYFDDAVFLGDSIIGQLSRYTHQLRQSGQPTLGTARFLYAGSYTLHSANLKSPGGKVSLLYRGIPGTPHGSLRRMGAGKAFVLLGLNDAAGYRLQKDLARYARLIDNIRAHSPGITLIALSLPPIAEGAQDKSFNQANLKAFNEGLAALCEEQNVLFLDITSPLADEQGYQRPDYSADGQVHLNEAGLSVLLSCLREFAQQQAAQAGP